MTTFADRIREAREGPEVQVKGMHLMSEPAAPAPVLDPRVGLPDEVAERIVTHGGPVDPTNPSARCDYCPRTTSADKLLEVELNRFACEVCRWRWAREEATNAT